MIEAMYQSNVHYVVGSTIVRYRKEIRPLYKQFYIESYISSLNNRSMYILHNFRTKGKIATTTCENNKIGSKEYDKKV